MRKFSVMRPSSKVLEPYGEAMMTLLVAASDGITGGNVVNTEGLP